jgi:hypothetical protein
MGIRGDLRNTIQTINPHSTPPMGIEWTMFFSPSFFVSIFFRWSPKEALAGSNCAPFRQTGLNRLG